MGGRIVLPDWWENILSRPRPHRLIAEKDYSGMEEPCEVCRWLAERLWVRHKAEQYGRLEPVPVEMEALNPATEDKEALEHGVRQIHACIRRLCLDGILLMLPASQFGEVSFYVNEVLDK